MDCPASLLAHPVNNTKTCFTNKMGIYSPNTETVIWTAENGVRIVSYIKGRNTKMVYPEYEKGNYLAVMIKLAGHAYAKGEGVFSQTLVKGTWPLNITYHWHLFFDPHLTPIVSSFMRYPQAESTVLEQPFNPAAQNDLSTPYNSALSRRSIQKINLTLSSFALPPDAYKIIHKSIESYFHTQKNFSIWANFADQQFFKPWANENIFREGLASFSSMAWATVSTFVLGVPEEEFYDHAHIWNTLLQDTKGILKQGFTLKWYFSDMKAYVLNTVRRIKSACNESNHFSFSSHLLVLLGN